MTDLFAQAEPELTLPELLREARLRNRLTVRDMATQLSCDENFYVELEAGGRVPGTKWIPKLSRLLTIPLDTLKDAVDTARETKAAEGKTADRAR